MPRGFSGNLIFAIIARMLCGNHLNCSLIRKILRKEAADVIRYSFKRQFSLPRVIFRYTCSCSFLVIWLSVNNYLFYLHLFWTILKYLNIIPHLLRLQFFLNVVNRKTLHATNTPRFKLKMQWEESKSFFRPLLDVKRATNPYTNIPISLS